MILKTVAGPIYVKSGINDARIGVRGSALTGENSRTGAKFVPGKSDIDVFAESSKLVEGLNTSLNPELKGMVSHRLLAKTYPEIAQWNDRWSALVGGKGASVAGFPARGLPNQPYEYWRP